MTWILLSTAACESASVVNGEPRYTSLLMDTGTVTDFQRGGSASILGEAVTVYWDWCGEFEASVMAEKNDERATTQEGNQPCQKL